MEEDVEGSLIREVALGDRVAFAHLVERTRAPLYRYLRTLTRGEAAEDALQETMIGVWRSAGTYQGTAPGRVWLYGLARRQAARTWRRRSGEPDATEPLDENLGRDAGFGADPEAAVAALEDRARLDRALERLSETDREIVLLRDGEGFTGPEVAELLGIPLAAAKTRLHRARLRLMAELRSEGGDHGA